MSQFCELQKDEKTYDYTMKYLNFLLTCEGTKNCISGVGNKIQHTEIEQHLENMHIYDREHRIKEEIIWVEKYAKTFRVYLNTVKLITLIFYMNKEIDHLNDISFEEFCKHVDGFNTIKNTLIDSIFVI